MTLGGGGEQSGENIVTRTLSCISRIASKAYSEIYLDEENDTTDNDALNWD